MALSVLDMATGRALPGPGQRLVSLILDLVILGLTGALVLSADVLSDPLGSVSFIGELRAAWPTCRVVPGPTSRSANQTPTKFRPMS
jgi:hypothetical protein